MARNFGQINSQTWTDNDFKQDLGVDAQWLYFVLLSQSNLNGAGIVPLQDRKWRKYARGMNDERIEGALEELQAHWYVVIDEETEEVLIRTFIRNDGLWKQPNVLKGALRSAKGTMSDTLRAVIWDELQRIPFSKLDEDRAAKARDLVGEYRDNLHGTLPEGFRNPPASPSGSPSELLERLQRAQNTPESAPAKAEAQVKGSQLPFDETLPEGFPEGFPNPSRRGLEPSGVGVGVGEGAGESLAEVQKTYSASSPYGEGDPESSSTPTGYDDTRFRMFWDHYPHKVSKKKACAAFEKAIKRTSFDTLMAGLHRYLTQDRRALDGFVKDPTTWLNGDCWDDEPLRAAGNGRPAPTGPARSTRNEWMANR